MDYEFTFDEYDRPIAEFSMEHYAIGQWLSHELGNNQQLLEEVLEGIEQLLAKRITHRQVDGREYLLRLSNEEAEIIDVALEHEDPDELPEDTHLYDDESYASRGLEDFKEMLESWSNFLDH